MLASFDLILKYGARVMMIHLLPPCHVHWGGSTSWSFSTFSSPPFLHQHQKVWMLAWPLSGDEPKAGSSDHLHYIKIFICRLVFYYIILIFFFGKRKKIAGDSKNESFWLFVCVYICERNYPVIFHSYNIFIRLLSQCFAEYTKFVAKYFLSNFSGRVFFF